MPVRLSKDEFMERLAERRHLFDLAMANDIKKLKLQLENNITVRFSTPNDISLDINARQIVREIAGEAILLMLDLVYKDLD
jgi:hypothetical protein